MLVAGLVVLVAESARGPSESAGVAAGADGQVETPSAQLPGTQGPSSAADAAVALAGGGESPPTTDAIAGVLDASPPIEGPDGVASTSFSDVLASIEDSLPEQR